MEHGKIHLSYTITKMNHFQNNRRDRPWPYSDDGDTMTSKTVLHSSSPKEKKIKVLAFVWSEKRKDDVGRENQN